MRTAPDLRLPLLMLGIAGLGIVAGVVRAVVLEGAGWWSMALWTPLMLAPVGVVAAYALWTARRSPQAATWGGIAAALAGAVFNFVVLHPDDNRDANIGLGLYALLGWVFPLAPAYLVGSLLGMLVERRRGFLPSPAALNDARPLPPLRPWLRPWLWPLVAPALVSLTVSAQPFLRLWQGESTRPDALVGTLLGFGVTSAGQLAVSLSPALIGLLILRSRAARDGVIRPRLAALWGLCLGLGVTLWLFGFGLRLMPGLSLELTMLLSIAPPILGYLSGRWLGTRPPKS
jgi:hypothetical protein